MCRCSLLFILAWLLAPLGASSQQEWSTTLPITAERRVQLRDAVPLANGNWLAVAQTDHVNGGHVTRARSWSILLNPSGQVLEIAPLVQGTRYIAAHAIVEGAADGLLHLAAVGWDSVGATGYGVSQFLFGPNGHLEGGMHTLFDNGSYDFLVYNAVLDQTGSLLVPGGAFIDPINHALPNKSMLMRIGLDGEALEQWYSGNGAFSMAMHAMPFDDHMLVSFMAFVGIGPSGHYRFLRFTDELEYVDGFAGTSVSGSGSVHPPDSSLRDGYYMTPLDNGAFAVSGQYGYTTNTGHRAALLRIGPTGEQEATFLPYNGTPQEMPAWLQGHDQATDGRIAFAMLENFNPSLLDFMSSTQPSRVRVYLLDSMLNVLCEQLVDGYEDGSYYFVNRIKSTPDGGTLLMGSRKDVNTTERPKAWIQKLPPWDCFTGIAEHDPQHAATVFPNPGTTGFTLALNGPHLSRGVLRLFDAQGREVGTTPLVESRAMVDADGLPSGIYLYRVTDMQGGVRATGRWVRE